MNDISVFLIGAAVALVVVYVVQKRPDRARPPLSPTREPLAAATPERWRADRVIERISEGVVLLDGLLRPVLINESGRAMLGVQEGALPARLPSEEIVSIAQRARESDDPVDELITVWFPSRARLQARATRLEDGILVLLDDVSQEVLAQEVRREFVAHASHELKSPVASLQTLAEAVREAAQDDPVAVERFSERLVVEATRLSRLVSDLLDLSRLEDAGAIPDEVVDIAEVVDRQIEQVENSAMAKAIDISAISPKGLMVRGDAQQLGLMVRNLLENAVRYTHDDGSISVEVRLLGEEATVCVRDSGIGIPLEAQSRVFERFYRVDRARSRDRGGTGLGLAIVKHVAELHGGHVSVQSELGEGSTFTVSLPLARVTDGLKTAAR